MANKRRRSTKSNTKLETTKIEKTLERLTPAKKESSNQIRLVRREGDDAPPILFYDTDKGVKLELRFTDGEPWFTQAQMATLFGKDLRTINEHIQKYMAEGEIDEAVIRKFRITAS